MYIVSIVIEKPYCSELKGGNSHPLHTYISPVIRSSSAVQDTETFYSKPVECSQIQPTAPTTDRRSYNHPRGWRVLPSGETN